MVKNAKCKSALQSYYNRECSPRLTMAIEGSQIRREGVAGVEDVFIEQQEIL